MWLFGVQVGLALLLAYLAAATAYLLLLALAYVLCRERRRPESSRQRRFAVLVPAHNEELLIADLLQSFMQVDYPRDRFRIFVIADNCSDGTVANCRNFPVTVLERRAPINPGKGQALAWGLEQIPLREYQAVLVVDADNVVDAALLAELNRQLAAGEQAIQCYNSVANRGDSWLTQLLYVSRTVGNLFYHEAKQRLGLSSYLMGNGICFSAPLLRQRGWTAFSTGEDWEYYAQLVADGIRIGFAARAKVFHQESRTLDQATSQRLRWSSGRFRVARTLGLRLFWKGVRRRDGRLLDASLPLIFPNYSLLVNLSLLASGLSLILPVGPARTSVLVLCCALLGGQVLLFVAGAFAAGVSWSLLRSVLCAPLFLLWKSVIDLLCLTGLYRGNRWVRTRRHRSPAGDG